MEGFVAMITLGASFFTSTPLTTSLSASSAASSRSSEMVLVAPGNFLSKSAVSWGSLSAATGNFTLVKFPVAADKRSEEHTSELQSRGHLVCRLLLERKKTISMQ